VKGDFGFDAALYHSVTDPNVSGKEGGVVGLKLALMPSVTEL
jgi:hypothetical protein